VEINETIRSLVREDNKRQGWSRAGDYFLRLKTITESKIAVTLLP
jgi:hypothetical protein